MDNLSKEKRSALMSKIRGKNTKPEMAVRRFIWGAGFRYRLHAKYLPGTPDLVFTSKKKVVFVHGCFWHGHRCRKDKLPKTRTSFWRQKIEKNRQRDLASVRKLRTLGWRVLTVWECQTTKLTVRQKLLRFLTE